MKAIFKSKIVKEVINDIEQEQRENQLNWEQKVDDWREKYIFRCEQLEEERKMLEERSFEAKYAKDDKESVQRHYWGLVLDEKKKVEALEKMLVEKDENTQISLLKEQHQKEIRELKRSKEIVDENYDHLSRDWLKSEDENEKLKKELEEKELMIEELEIRIEEEEEISNCHLDALEVAKQWRIRQSKEKDDKIEMLGNAVAWQSYLRDKKLKELPSLPKKEKRFKLLSNKVKNKVSQTKEIVREKFNAYILQKNK